MKNICFWDADLNLKNSLFNQSFLNKALPKFLGPHEGQLSFNRSRVLRSSLFKTLYCILRYNDEGLIYSANFSVSKKDFTQLREEMVQVIQRFLVVVKDSPADDIAQFNLDFFWIKK